MSSAEEAFSLCVVPPKTVLCDSYGSLGIHTLRIWDGRESLLYIPKNYRPVLPSPLIVLFHGAKGAPSEWVELFRPIADSMNIIFLAPSSSGLTWDLVPEAKGPDVHRLGILMNEVLRRYSIDASHVAVGGFSDGASYALAMGLMNPRVFTHVIALSPGSLTVPLGQPGIKVFMAHGAQDPVLPIAASRRIYSRLLSAGYSVEYIKFESGHRVPLAIARSAVDMFLR